MTTGPGPSLAARQRSAIAGVLFGVAVAAAAFSAAYYGRSLTALGSALLAGAAGLVPPAIERLWDRREPLLTIGLLVGAVVLGAGAFTQRPLIDPPAEAHYPPITASTSASSGAASTPAAPSATVPASSSSASTATARSAAPSPTAVEVPVPPVAEDSPSAAAVESDPPTAVPRAVTVYDNYGPALQPGHAMCTGNPGRPESMPGGSLSQTFTVPAEVAAITGAMVQIDPNAQVTAHATLSAANGQSVSSSAAAAGDTTFQFSALPVSPGQTATLSISFTATQGKLITVYTAGSPGGTFTARNSCSDGAPSLTRSPAGLRAVISGRT